MQTSLWSDLTTREPEVLAGWIDAYDRYVMHCELCDDIPGSDTFTQFYLRAKKEMQDNGMTEFEWLVEHSEHFRITYG